MNIPVAVPHQMMVATTHSIRSTQIPAMVVEIRAFLSPTIQTWVQSHMKVGAKYISMKLHALHSGAEVLAGKAVSGFVKKSHGSEQEPEFHQVPGGFRGEIVEGKTVAPDLAELVGPHPHHNPKHDR